MNTSERMRECQRGVGLIEVMISIIIGMLMVLVIYQIYEVSEGQKRTITAGSDAQQNASYGLYALGRDLSMAGNGVASSAPALSGCPFNAVTPGPWVLPVPVVINTGASGNDPDTITVFYGGSSSLSTPVQFRQTSTTAQAYVVPGPVGFSPNDVIVAVQGTACTVSTIDAGPGSVVVNPATGVATITHTPVPGSPAATYAAVSASLVNLGPAKSMGRIAYTVDTGTPTATNALRTQNQLPTAGPVNPVISEVVNLKAQYGLDTTVPPDGIIDTWEDSNGAWWQGFIALAPADPQRLIQLRQLLAVRIAIVTRSAQYEKDSVTLGPLTMFDAPLPVSMTLNAACPPCDQHYRYKVLETIVPMRNALWNTQ